MKTLLASVLLLALAGCMNGALIGTQEAQDKAYIVQLLQQDHARFTQKDVDWIYERSKSYAAMPVYDPMFDAPYAPAYSPSYQYVPGTGMMPRGRSNCMQYGTLGQGGQFSCW